MRGTRPGHCGTPAGRRSGGRRSRVAAARALALGAALGVAGGCAGAFPVERGNVLVVERASQPLVPADAEYATTLQVRWLGAACHVLRLGDVAVVTDPFVSNQSLLRVLAGAEIVSDETRVRRAFGGERAPQAVFAAHAHYDHLLDAGSLLSLPGWESVPLFGGATTRNVLRGWGSDVAAHWRPAGTGEGWHEAWCSPDGTSRVEYAAYPATHAPQAFGVRAWSGCVGEPLDEPPDTAGDFQLGEVHTFLVRLTHAGTTVTVWIASSATDWPHGSPPASMGPADVALLCVPGWGSADGYPERYLAALRPRDVVLTHFDDFFETDDAAPRRTVALADFDGFLRSVERATTYPRFRQIVVPDVGATVRIRCDAGLGGSPGTEP